MTWLTAWTATVEAFRAVFSWKTGGRTRDENKDRDEANHWAEEERKALAGGDLAHASFAREQLRRVLHRVHAKD